MYLKYTNMLLLYIYERMIIVDNPLKNKRIKSKLTKETIAKKLDTKLYNIKEWECGRNTPKSYMIIDIANAYELNNNEIIEYLIYLKYKRSGSLSQID